MGSKRQLMDCGSSAPCLVPPARPIGLSKVVSGGDSPEEVERQADRQVEEVEKQADRQVEVVEKPADRQVGELEKPADRQVGEVERRAERQVEEVERRAERQVEEVEKQADRQVGNGRTESLRTFRQGEGSACLPAGLQGKRGLSRPGSGCDCQTEAARSGSATWHR